MSFLRIKRRPGLFLLLTILGSQLFLWRRFLFGELFFIGNGDRLSFEIPYYIFATRWLEKGILPFWDPYIAFGTNLLGVPSYNPFYPFQYLIYLFGEEYLLLAQTWYWFFNWVLGAFFFYLFAKNYFASFWSIVIATSVYTFNMFFMLQLGLGYTYISILYTPLILLLLFKANRDNFLKYSVGIGLLYALELQGGFLQLTFYLSLFYGFFVLSLIDKTNWKIKLPTLLLGALLGIGLSSSRWLPFLAESKNLWRSSVSLVTYLHSEGVPPLQAIRRLLDPFALGARYSETQPFSNFYEDLPVFSSCVALSLSLVALVLFCFHRQKRVLVFGTTAILSLWTIFGGLPLKLLFILWQQKAILHNRIAIFLPLAFAFLSGLVIDNIKKGAIPSKTIRRSFFIANSILFFGSLLIWVKVGRANSLVIYSILFVLLFVSFFRFRKWNTIYQKLLPVALAILCFVELFLFNERLWNPPYPQAEINAKNDFPIAYGASLIQKDQGFASWLQKVRGTYASDNFYRLFIEGAIQDNPDQNLLPHLYEIPAISGYLNAFPNNLLGFLYVDFLKQLKEAGGSLLIHRHIQKEFISGNSARALRLKYFHAGDKILEVSGEPSAPYLYLAEDIAKERIAKRTYWDPNKIVIQTQSPKREFLVLNELFHENWKAYLDKEPVEIIPTNDIMRGVILPPGDHEVVFQYQIKHRGVILLATGGAALFSLFLLLLHRSRLKKGKGILGEHLEAIPEELG